VSAVAVAAAARGADPVAAAAPLVAASKAMREILETVARCAPTDAPVLIRGEADTGKETIAREIHRRSRRAGGALVRVACGALRETEIAERLFGHRLRSFDRGGAAALTFLEEARGGTLFLKDVAALPPWAQSRLLDAIQQATVCRDGNAEADMRVIASTSADLRTATAEQAFLPSLYHYLSVVQLDVPSLRHRPQDVRPLAEACLAAANAMRVGETGRKP
jgi:DNA-binding NtrC family response regulator